MLRTPLIRRSIVSFSLPLSFVLPSFRASLRRVAAPGPVPSTRGHNSPFDEGRTKGRDYLGFRLREPGTFSTAVLLLIGKLAGS